MTINLVNPKKIITQPEVSQTLNSVTVVSTVDSPIAKTVVANLQEISTPLVLWEGDAYDAAGQWTDSDVQARIQALLQ